MLQRPTYGLTWDTMLAEIGSHAILLRLERVRREVLSRALVDLLGFAAEDAAAYVGGTLLADLPDARGIVDGRYREIRCERLGWGEPDA